MFLTPQQRIGVVERENVHKFERDLMAAQVAAQPDPIMAAVGNGLSSIGGALVSAGSGSFGGGGGSSSKSNSQVVSNYRMSSQYQTGGPSWQDSQ